MAFVEEVGDPPCVTVHDLLARGAAVDPHRVAIVGDAKTWTAQDLAVLAASMSAAVPAGPAVSSGALATVVVEADSRELLGLGVVAAASTATVVPMQMDLPVGARAGLIDRVRPDLVVRVEDVVGRAAAPRSHRRSELDDPALVLTTSGSTSVPKLVPNTHRNLWASARAAALAYDLGPHDRTLALGSMAHALGLRAVTDALWCGGVALVPESVTVDGVAQYLVEHEPTCVVASPALLNVLASALETLEHQERETVIAALRVVRSGSAALRPSLAERLRGVLGGVPVLHGYGMTEAAKIACTTLHHVTPAGSVGRPLGVEVRLDDGEIVVRGDCVAPGYLDDGHESASAFEDGWFRTGDLGRLDERGNLFLLGRKDDVVSRGGELVSLPALERALELHPSVQAALAAPVEHRSLGTDVVLAYVPVDGASPSATELHAFVGERVASGHAPLRIVPVDALPLTPTGKPSRQLLAESLTIDPRARAAEADREDRLATEIDGTELQLATLWTEILLLDAPVTADDDFFALGADSLHLVELCTAIEDTFGVAVMPGAIIERPRLGQLAELVRDGRRTGARPILVPVRAGDDDSTPLYIVPGQGGTLAHVHRFVYHLAPGRPVYGFEAPGVYFGERPIKSVRRLARRYVDELLAHAGDKQFVLVGMSFGAVVAHEMAAQLEAASRPPALVAMFDCTVPRFQPVRSRRVFLRAASWLRHPILSRRKSQLRPPVFRVASVAWRAGRRHRPRAVSSPVAMFTSEVNRVRTGDPLFGWGRHLHGPVTRFDHPGGHRQLTRSRADLTAAQLDELLTSCDRS